MTSSDKASSFVRPSSPETTTVFNLWRRRRFAGGCFNDIDAVPKVRLWFATTFYCRCTFLPASGDGSVAPHDCSAAVAAAAVAATTYLLMQPLSPWTLLCNRAAISFRICPNLFGQELKQRLVLLFCVHR
jgi:hypothetical protein